MKKKINFNYICEDLFGNQKKIFIKLLPIFLLVLFLVSCSNSKSSTTNSSNTVSKIPKNSLEGTWVLKNVLMGDAMDAPCGFSNLDTTKEMNIVFTSETSSGNLMKLHGQSSVNTFMGSYSILSYDEKTKTGKIKFEPIASTKMAATNEDFSHCETRYLTYLEKSEEFKIEGNKLQLTKIYPLKKSEYGNSPFGENYRNTLYFEKR